MLSKLQAAINKAGAYLGKAKTFLKGKKTYLAATLLLLQALLVYIEQIINLEGLSALFAWAKDLPLNPATLLTAEALGLFGLRAAVSK
ncbi:MAG: hypothetical protein LBR90_04715 [Elusimicrobiota bacterium]|jgi:hypothetical protein|nr:hypothetical protein [Elusimicrobiota bacterium]